MPIELPVLQDLRMNLRASGRRPRNCGGARSLPTRFGPAILRMLHDGPVCVCEMAAALGARENNVSNHLAKLRDAGLVRASRFGVDTRRVYYERDDEACRRALAALGVVLR